MSIDSNAQKILILTPFRVGSTSIQKTLLSQTDLTVHKLHSYDQQDYKIIPPNLVNAIIFIHRQPIDLYISAYFADCTRPEYPYYFGTLKQVLDAPIDTLIAHFKSFNWETFGWLNYDYYINTLHETFKIDTDEIKAFISSDSKEKFKLLVGQSDSQFILFIMLKTQYLDESLHIINTVLNVNVKKMEKHRTAQASAYAKKYFDFKKRFETLQDPLQMAITKTVPEELQDMLDYLKESIRDLALDVYPRQARQVEDHVLLIDKKGKEWKLSVQISPL